MKLALPKGRLQGSTANLLKQAGLVLDDYHESSRSYRPQCPSHPEMFFKVFQEKDIAIQVAVGNYDLGICGLDWIEELLVKYRTEAVVKIRDLGYGKRALYAASASNGRTFEAMKGGGGAITIVSEYPNMAESFALQNRLRRFRIFQVWGAADGYPPEHADLVILSGGGMASGQLAPVATLFEGNAFLIANKRSLEEKDLSSLLAALCNVDITDGQVEGSPAGGAVSTPHTFDKSLVTLALPDGHQQGHAASFLKKCGVNMEGYEKGAPTRRPRIDIEGMAVKVIRPQDMPLQVANGNFDLAITGRDWLLDHLYLFPKSPVKELANLGFGKVRIVAVVSNDLPVSCLDDLKAMACTATLRVASEYTNLADKYARNSHLTPYRVIPTWGATEAFLPEDADVLIENTETGATLAKHNLRIIDNLMESTGCLIGNTDAIERPDKKRKVESFVEIMRRGVGPSTAVR